MVNKVFSKEQVVLEIMETAISAAEKTANSVHFNFTPLTTGTSLYVIIAESLEKFADWLYALRINISKSSTEQLIEFNEILSQLIAGTEVDIDSINGRYWNHGLSGIEIEDHRNDPPYVYEEEELHENEL